MQDTGFPVFDELARRDHEQVVFCRDEASGLRAVIGIHNTVLGPALGGCRMYPYKSEQEAVVDVLRLARGMTYKAAVAGLNLGGGKAVIIGDPKKDKSERLFRALGRFIEGMGGRYITAEDAGTSMRDMEYMRMETNYVVGISRSLGGSGDPSPVTALGVFSGMRAAIEERFGKSSLAGMKVAVQGVGHVGYNLVGHLVRAGAKVLVADVDADSVKRTVADFRVEGVAPDAIYDVDCDIFAPCAMGGIVNEKTIGRLKCSIIAGAANNQLGEEKTDGARLAQRGILYSPDFVINAGGLINVANELEGYNQERALDQAEGIYDILKAVFARAKAENIATYRAANNLAMDRIESIGKIRRTYKGTSAVRASWRGIV
jgi:leucine dehydrogenase